MRFTDHFSVGQPADADWFDLSVLMDTPLYVDPFLVFGENGEENVWTGAHEEIVDFFAAALDLVKRLMVTRTRCTGRRPCASSSFPSPRSSRWACPWGTPGVQGSVPIWRSTSAGASIGGGSHQRPGVQHPQTPLRGVHTGHLSRAGDSCRGREAEQQRLDSPGQPLEARQSATAQEPGLRWRDPPRP